MKPRFLPKSAISENVATGGNMDDEDAKRLAEEAAEKAVEKALAKKKKKEDDDGGGGSGDPDFGFSPKTVKSMENMANFFNVMKKVFSNPLQDAVENKVGGLAASVVERAFSPPTHPQNKDIIDQVLNSQFAAGLGAGLGQRGPEMVDKLTSIYGPDKTEKWIDGIAGKGGVGGVSMRGGGSMGGGGMGGMGGGSSMGGSGEKQSEMEMVLSLDPNNPEHVAAYANSQGGMSVDVARKVLQIAQDDFVRQLKMKGVDTSGYDARSIGGSIGGSIHGNVHDGSQGGVGGVDGNVQEYRRSAQRSEDLMPIAPIDEDKRWENPKMERVDGPSIADLGKTQNVNKDYVGENVNVEQQVVNTTEIAEYLKNLNEYVIGLKDTVEKQQQQQNAVNNDMSSLRQELDILKRDRIVPDDMLKKDEDEVGTGVGTGVRSVKTIKKGFSYVKDEKEE